MEKIALLGGPSNGQIVMWRGGDLYFVEEMRPLPLSVAARASDPVGPLSVNRHCYRRSDNDRGVFVWQPPRK